MSRPESPILVACKRTLLAKTEEFRVEQLAKITTKKYPVFKLASEFGESKETRVSECPFCHRTFKYKTYRWEFSLRKPLKKVGILLGVCIALFIVALFLIGIGLDIDLVGYVLIVPSIVGIILGLGIGFIEVLRHLMFYRKQNYRYKCEIKDRHHVLVAKGETIGNVGIWRELPYQAQ